MKNMPANPNVRVPKAATITEILPAHTYMEGIVERRAAEVVKVVEDESKDSHFMVTGSLNGVWTSEKKVGQKGWIKWVQSSTAFYPYFTADKDR